MLRLIDGDHRASPLLDDTPEGGAGKRLLVADLAHSALGAAPTELAPVPLPDRIGAYRVLGLLGVGGMGVVYEAEQDRPRRRVAIKTIRPQLVSEATRSRFHHEVEVMGTLEHPAIPRVYLTGQHEGVDFIVMELVHGRPIDAHVRGRGERERLELLLRVMDGVHHAHEAGIVHADLKPQNILITLDAEPKVIDFGLAVSTNLGASSRGPAGTRGYMAPEQRLGGARPDRRSDVYALGVTLDELLGDPGTPAPAVRHRDLRCIIARATAEAPEARYATVAALADDVRRYLTVRPVQARRPTPLYRAARLLQRHRRLAWAVVAVAVVTALFAVAVAVVAERQRQAAEERAAARLEALEVQLAGLYERDEVARAEAVFETFARMRDNAGTRALYDGWTWQAEQQARLGASDRAAAAYAQAYNAAVDDATRSEALERLAQAFADAGEWRSLELALTRVEGGATSAGMRSLRRRSLAQRRDFAALAEGALVDDAAAVARGWGAAARIGPMDDGAVLTRWRGEPAIFVADRVARQARWVAARAPHRVLARAPLPADARVGLTFPQTIGDAGGWLLGADLDGRTVLWEWEADDADPAGVLGTLAPRFSAHLGQLQTVAGWPTADGRPFAFIGTARDTRTILTLAPGPGEGTFTLAEAPYALRGPPSDVDVLVLDDVDRDGGDELVVVLGAWFAYDLRVLAVGGRGEASLIARRRFGVATGATTLTVGERRLIAVSKIDRYPNPTIHGAATPFGSPPGVYLFELVDGALVERARIPMPSAIGDGYIANKLLAGDLDGDGLTDLVVGVRSSPHGPQTVVLRQRPGLRFDALVVGAMLPELVLQVDEDAADELLVRLHDRGGEGWVLGAGAEQVPALHSESVPVLQQALPVLDDPALTQVWRGARELAALGLREAAAAELLAGAMMSATPATRAHLLVESATLLEDLEQVQSAALRFDEALATAGIAPADRVLALAGAARCALVDYEPRRARPHLEELRRAEGAQRLAAWADETLAWLGPLLAEGAPAAAIDLVGPLPSEVLVEAPHALERSLGVPGLAVATTGGLGDLARVPVRYDGGHLAIEVDLELRYLEIGAGLHIRLRTPTGVELPLGLHLHGTGGRLHVQRVAGCAAPSGVSSPSTERERASDASPERLRLRVDYLPAQGARVTCRQWGADDEALTLREAIALPAPVPPGDYELVFAAVGIDDGALTVMRALVHRVELNGLTPRVVAPDALQAAHHRYLVGDHRGALAAYRRLPGAERWVLMAALDVAADAQLDEPLRALLAAPAGEGRRVLRQLMRLRPDRLVPALSRVEPASFARELAEVWRVGIRYVADAAVRRLLASETLAGLVPSGDPEIRLLTARAELFLRGGHHGRSLEALGPALTLAATPERGAALAEARLVAARASLALGDHPEVRRHMAAWLALSRIPELDREALTQREDGSALIAFLP